MSRSPVLHVVDSHTGGEPTRVVIDGLPPLDWGTIQQRRDQLAQQADWVRRTLTHEPRGAAWMVGAALVPPIQPHHTTGVVFFNNAGYLGMCGHGLIGAVATLQHLGKIQAGLHCFETPAGDVTVELHADGSVSFENVTSFRLRKDVTLRVPEVGDVVGDIAYGGNWFFLVATDKLDRCMRESLTIKTRRIMQALKVQGLRGTKDALIDHVELVGPPTDPETADAKNFVLCPGGQYDRSPCGTGTSAKLACLAADGKLAPGQEWRQESIIGSIFRGRYRRAKDGIVPTITGRAFVTGEVSIIVDDHDPFRHGFEEG